MTSGYVREKVYRLVFEDEEYEGLVVRARSAPMGELVHLVALAQEAQATTTPDVSVLEKLFEPFARCLIEWNLTTPGGDPVPTTMAGVMGQDLEFGLALIEAWLEAVAGVPVPLGPASTAGSASADPNPDLDRMEFELGIPSEPVSRAN